MLIKVSDTSVSNSLVTSDLVLELVEIFGLSLKYQCQSSMVKLSARMLELRTSFVMNLSQLSTVFMRDLSML